MRRGRWVLCALLLLGCHRAGALLDDTKRGISNPSLSFNAENFMRAMASHERAQTRLRALSLPGYRPGTSASREVSSSLVSACEAHDETVEILDAATLPAPEGCTQRGRITYTASCVLEKSMLRHTWRYENFEMHCGDAVQRYEGDVELEVKSELSTETYLLAVALDDARSATFSAWSYGTLEAEAIVLEDAGKRALVYWTRELSGNPPPVSRDLTCFAAHDETRLLLGTYIAERQLSLYAPETLKEPARYIVQRPAESVIVQGCQADLTYNLCWLGACD
jgi:hypothetical protein